MALIRFAMRHPITLMMVVVALLGLGGVAVYEMRIDIFPAFDMPEVYIIQNYIGMLVDEATVSIENIHVQTERTASLSSAAAGRPPSPACWPCCASSPSSSLPS